MTGRRWWSSGVVETLCTIEIEQTGEFFFAHLLLDADVEIRAGDKVCVHGAPVRVAFGQKLVERRSATVERANWFGRAWTKLVSRFELAELYDVSFTPGRAL